MPTYRPYIFRGMLAGTRYLNFGFTHEKVISSCPCMSHNLALYIYLSLVMKKKQSTYPFCQLKFRLGLHGGVVVVSDLL